MSRINRKAYLDRAIALRRDLHKIPEEGLKEFQTRDYIIAFLKKNQIGMLTDVYETAVVAILGPKDAPAIAFRADMDGLLVKEETGVDFASDHKGMMHACGHDGHMTILLLFAEYLKSRKEELKQKVLLIFQPAEEGPGGAEGIVHSQLLKQHNVQVIYGLHLYPALGAHKIGIKEGALMAQTSEFSIRVNGASAHGAQPHQGRDAILAAAELITALQSIVSRRLSPLEPAVITIGKLEAGERVNIIAKQALMDGTMRTFSPVVHAKIQKEIDRIAQGIALATECEVQVEFRDMYPAVINDEELTKKAEMQLKAYLSVKPIEAQMLAEDFAYYQLEVPGLFFFLGTKNEEKGYVHPLHHASFNFDEEVLLTGLEAFSILYFGEDYA